MEIYFMKSTSTHTWKTPFLALGPVLSILVSPALLNGFILPGEAPLTTLVVLALWSPLFFSIPALVLADARDKTLTHYRGILGSIARGLLLVPALMRNNSPVKIEMRASILGFFLAFFVASPTLVGLPPIF